MGIQQICKVCGRVDKFDFHITDKLWAKVIPLKYLNKVVCLACFDNFAKMQGIEYAGSLQRIYFAGDQASFEFMVVARSG